MALAEKALNKLDYSWRNRANWSCRQLAAHYGLLFWAYGILDVDLSRYYNALRFLAAAGSELQAAPDLWDTPANVWPSAWRDLEQWTSAVARNAPRRVHERSEPVWVVVTDASAWGWGYVAHERATSRVQIHGEHWKPEFMRRHGDKIGRSTFTEPQAVINALCHLLRAPIATTRVLLFTDNTVTRSAYARGYNIRSYDNNECLQRLHKIFGSSLIVDYAYVEGPRNPADAASRGLASETDREIARDALEQLFREWAASRLLK